MPVTTRTTRRTGGPPPNDNRRREEGVTVRYGGRGGRAFEVVPSTRHVVVRSLARLPIFEPRRPFEVTPLSSEARDLLDQYQLEFRLPMVGVEVLRCRRPFQEVERAAMLTLLNKEPHIDFAGRVLLDPQGKRPVIYTENLFVKFTDGERPAACRQILERFSLRILRELPYATNAWLAEA